MQQASTVPLGTSFFSPGLRAALLVPNFLHLLPLLLCLIYHHYPCFCKLTRYKFYVVNCAMVSVIPPESWKMEKHRLKTTERFCLSGTSQNMLPAQPRCLSEHVACIASLPLRACFLHSLAAFHFESYLLLALSSRVYHGPLKNNFILKCFYLSTDCESIYKTCTGCPAVTYSWHRLSVSGLKNPLSKYSKFWNHGKI